MGDDAGDLTALFEQAISRAHVVILTGGLGPTADDVTRETVAAALGLALEEDPELLAGLRRRFEARGLSMPEINRRQALVPRGATILPNPNGTAPGLWIEARGRIVVMLPGPPREVHPIVEKDLQPRLAARTAGRLLKRRIVKTTGRAESLVDETAQPLYAEMTSWAVPVETTILAAPGQIELHLSARGDDSGRLDAALERAVQMLSAALGDIVFSTDGRNLPEIVGGLLLERRSRIAVAESCTGGLVLGRLTEVPGSSQWVIGGVTAYDNDVKTEQLGVPVEMIAAEGAVSEPVALAMADGIRVRLHADIGVGVTGVAGPSGGTASKPVGTVVIAVCTSTSREARTFRFPGDRPMVRLFATQAALDQLRRRLASP